MVIAGWMVKCMNKNYFTNITLCFFYTLDWSLVIGHWSLVRIAFWILCFIYFTSSDIV